MLIVGAYLFLKRGADYMPVWMGWLVGSLLWYGGLIVSLFWFLERAFGESDMQQKPSAEKVQESMKDSRNLAHGADSSAAHETKTRVAGTIALGIASILLSLHATAVAQDSSAVFKAKCAPCHGTSGDAKTPMGTRLNIHDLQSAEVQKQSETELVQIISKGRGKMPAYESKLTRDQIGELISYIRKLGHKN
jgi:cytochrome c6